VPLRVRATSWHGGAGRQLQKGTLKVLDALFGPSPDLLGKQALVDAALVGVDHGVDSPVPARRPARLVT
jgi:hypothetical protein